MFGLSALATKLIGGAVVVTVLAGGFFAVKSHYYNQGWNAHALAMEVQDGKAIEAARLARETVAKCRDSGGEWSVADGVCEHGAR